MWCCKRKGYLQNEMDSTILNDDETSENKPRSRRKGFPCVTLEENEEEVENQPDIPIVEKDEKSVNMIKKAILENEFLSNLFNEEQLQLIIDVMYLKPISENQLIIKEGETGSHLYVSAEGLFEVIKENNNVVKKFGVGVAFGELALLYSAQRLASIRAATLAKAWVLDRYVFQNVMKRTVLQECESNIQFLRSVPVFRELHPSILSKVSDLLKKEFFKPGTEIVHQGEAGDKFYIIRAGTVNITKLIDGEERSYGNLTSGHYFGELALRNTADVRQATITALDSGAECLTLDREAFTKFLGDIEELQNDKKYIAKPIEPVTSEFGYIKLQDLKVIRPLGIGGFGSVDLVQYKDDTNMVFALKKWSKHKLVQQKQQSHAYNEKNILVVCNSPFICRLYQTYRDSKYIYFLLEACLGGDVWMILDQKREFNEEAAKFVSACVIQAIAYLHQRNIIYRDLKPENLVLDNKGYVKLIDFGFSKYLEDGVKTWTHAGTVEYVAPEVILNRGHNKSVDYYALGILLYELFTGSTPFVSRDSMKIYNLILKGIDYIIFSEKIPDVVQNLIKKLSKTSSTERLGCFHGGVDDIRNHEWYYGFDWKALNDGALPSPLNKIGSNYGFQNVARAEPPEELSGWDCDF